MTLQEMLDHVVVESGQFLIPVENLEMNRDRFATLVKATLGIYNGKHPYELKFNMDFPMRSKKFDDATLSLDGQKVGIPEGIADMTPVRIAGVAPYFIRDYHSHESTYLNQKTEMPWEYRRPTLYVPLQGRWDVHAWYNHKITEIVKEGETEGETKQLECATITLEEDHLFLKLLKAKFLRGTAGSRRAFTMQDIPLLTDAGDLMADAKAMEEEALKELDDKTKFWLGWG